MYGNTEPRKWLVALLDALEFVWVKNQPKNLFNLIPGTSCGSLALALLLLMVRGPQFGKHCTNECCWPGALVILPAVHLYYLDVIGKEGEVMKMRNPSLLA